MYSNKTVTVTTLLSQQRVYSLLWLFFFTIHFLYRLLAEVELVSMFLMRIHSQSIAVREQNIFRSFTIVSTEAWLFFVSTNEQTLPPSLTVFFYHTLYRVLAEVELVSKFSIQIQNQSIAARSKHISLFYKCFHESVVFFISTNEPIPPHPLAYLLYF